MITIHQLCPRCVLFGRRKAHKRIVVVAPEYFIMGAQNERFPINNFICWCCRLSVDKLDIYLRNYLHGIKCLEVSTVPWIGLLKRYPIEIPEAKINKLMRYCIPNIRPSPKDFEECRGKASVLISPNGWYLGFTMSSLFLRKLIPADLKEKRICSWVDNPTADTKFYKDLFRNIITFCYFLWHWKDILKDNLFIALVNLMIVNAKND